MNDTMSIFTNELFNYNKGCSRADGPYCLFVVIIGSPTCHHFLINTHGCLMFLPREKWFAKSIPLSPSYLTWHLHKIGAHSLTSSRYTRHTTPETKDDNTACFHKRRTRLQIKGRESQHVHSVTWNCVHWFANYNKMHYMRRKIVLQQTVARDNRIQG